MATSPEIRSTIRVLEEFKKIDEDITLPSILMFLYVAEADARSGNQHEVTERLDMSGATASRAVSHWLQYKRPRVSGLDMIESLPDPEDRRYKMLSLNRKGLNFLNTLKEAYHGPTAR